MSKGLVESYWDNLSNKFRTYSSDNHAFIMNDQDLEVFKFIGSNFKDKRILVLGSTIPFLKLVKDINYKELVFIDISSDMLSRITDEEDYDSSKIELVHKSWNKLDESYYNRFDLVLCCGSFNVYGDFKSNKELFKICSNLLKKEGTLVVRYFDNKNVLLKAQGFQWYNLISSDKVDYSISKGVVYNFGTLNEFLEICPKDNFIIKECIKSEYNLFPIIRFVNV